MKTVTTILFVILFSISIISINWSPEYQIPRKNRSIVFDQYFDPELGVLETASYDHTGGIGKLNVLNDIRSAFDQSIRPFGLENSTYSSSQSIVINSNDDFAQYLFPVSGSRENPYLIEGLNFTNSETTSLTIGQTDAYFIIQNNYINGRLNF